MEKIVTHPLYIRCKKVIESCQTPEQVDIAEKYCRLARTKTSSNISTEINYNTHTVLWEVLELSCIFKRKESEWS